AQEQGAIDLAMFARAGGAPVPRICGTNVGERIAEADGVALSLWEYVIDAETAEGGLAGDRWTNVGLVLGRLHRHLAEHPACCPTVQPAAELRDLEHDRCRFDRLIAAYRHLGSLSED